MLFTPSKNSSDLNFTNIFYATLILSPIYTTLLLTLTHNNNYTKVQKASLKSNVQNSLCTVTAKKFEDIPLHLHDLQNIDCLNKKDCVTERWGVNNIDKRIKNSSSPQNWQKYPSVLWN